MRPGHPLLFLSNSVQTAFRCLSLPVFFSPSPDPSPSHHTLKSRFGQTGTDLSHILGTPNPNETRIIEDDPTVAPQHYMLCNRAGEGTCPWRGLGIVNVSQRLLRAGHICHRCQNREMSDISHGAAFAAPSLLRGRVLVSLTAGEVCRLYPWTPGT